MTLDYFYGQAGELFSFFRIPKALSQEQRFQNLSTDAKILYGILLDRMSLSAKNGWRDEQGRVYIIYTVQEVQKSLCCAEHKAVKLLRELEDIDLVERKRRGLGRPSLVYVKDFSSGLPKAQVQNCQNSNSGAAEIAILEQPKPQANKTNKNNTEMSETNPFYSEEAEGMGKREQLKEYFSQSLEVELLLRLCPDDEDTIHGDNLEALKALLPQYEGKVKCIYIVILTPILMSILSSENAVRLNFIIHIMFLALFEMRNYNVLCGGAKWTI